MTAPLEQPTNREAIERRLIDLDYAIFDHLPDEGSKLGYHPLIKSAKQLLSELNGALPDEVPKMKIGELNGRLRALRNPGGLVVPVSVSLSGKIDGWQRTRRASELLRAKQMTDHGTEER